MALAIKQIAWKSVIIPNMMPKPDLMPLTGGYRKTPVLQVGADIYCDTAAGAVFKRPKTVPPHATTDIEEVLAPPILQRQGRGPLPELLFMLGQDLGIGIPFVAEAVG